MDNGLPPAVGETWLLWEDGDRSPAANMAIDEALLRTAPERGQPLIRFYGWDRPAVSIGYVQSRSAAPSGFAVVRRPTGGGVVYHDHDFTYTAVLPAGHWLTGLDRTRSYDWINRCVQDALVALALRPAMARNEIPHDVDRSTMVCFQNPTRYDVLLHSRKVAGSAQRRTRDGILHQGSIHFGMPLPLPKTDLAAALRNAFTQTLGMVLQPFQPGEGLLQRAQQLETETYANEDWNNRR